MSETGKGLPLRMRNQLEDYRRRVWILKMVEGGLAALAGLLLSCLAVFVLDRFMDTPQVLRLLLLLGGSAGCYLFLPLRLRRWVLGHRRLDQVARLVRRRFPRLGDELLGIVELAQGRDDRNTSPVLYRAAVRQVDRQLATSDLSGALPPARCRSWAWWAGVPALILLILAVAVPSAGGNALLRWLLPWSDVERYTFARIERVEGGLVVPYAEPFEVVARLDPDSRWKPREGRILLSDRPAVDASLDEDAYRFALPPHTREDALALRVGDDREAVAVRPTLRPVLDGLEASIELPVYLQRTVPLRTDARSGTLRPLRESRVTLHGTASRPLARATLDGRPLEVEGRDLRTGAIAADGPSLHRLAWEDTLGLASREPKPIAIEPREDQAPQVDFLSFRPRHVLLSTRSLDLELRATDDYGIRQVGLEWEGLTDPAGGEEPARGELRADEGGPEEQDLTLALAFAPERLGVAPQSLRLRAWAEDYLPGRERSGSHWMVIRVMTPDEHHRWLAQRLEEWMQAAREVHDRELQLHRINRDLMALSPEELSRPETQDRLRKQAASEASNASRLDSITGIGREWLAEAVHNGEFDPGELESLARLLETLEELARERMPSVASLLEEASRPEPAPAEGEPSGSLAETPPAEGEAGGKGSGTSRETPPNPLVSNPPLLSRENEEKEGGSNPGPFSLQFPSTRLGDGKGSGGASAALEQAVEDQEAILKALAELAGEMNQLLRRLENSTFIRRLMAASRTQLDLAIDLDGLNTFGRSPAQEDNSAELEALGERESAASRRMTDFLMDLDAYVGRRPIETHMEVLDEMKEVEVDISLERLAASIRGNLVGQSTIEAENWADALDQWAAALAGEPSSGSGGGSSRTKPSIPPELVLALLRILDGEMDLRESFRSWDRRDPGSEDWEAEGTRLGDRQDEIVGKTRKLLQGLMALPLSDHYAQDISKVYQASLVMDEVTDRLRLHQAGPETMAAITEVIEILLGVCRSCCNSGSGGGGSGSSPGAGSPGDLTGSALMRLYLRQSGGEPLLEARAPEQATGKAGRAWPDEYRQGLDAYINALERLRR